LAAAAGEALAGQAVSDEAIATAAAAAQNSATPISDMRGPAGFRTHLVGVLVTRTLEGAIARARGKFVANAVQEAAG
jgi:carbon-monoxide dehydrogenase medium subunit